MEISETLDAGPITLQRWTVDRAEDLDQAINESSCLAAAGLGQPGIDRVEIHHDVDNPASGRVAAEAGFHETGAIAARKKAPSDSGTHLVWVRETDDVTVPQDQPVPPDARAVSGGR